MSKHPRYSVYWNLHRKLWSCKNMATGKVQWHLRTLILENVSYIVSEAGRQRVLKEKRKNVHAFARGEHRGLSALVGLDLEMHAITYNPYKYDSFVYAATEQPIDRSDFCMLCANGKIFAINIAEERT